MRKKKGDLIIGGSTCLSGRAEMSVAAGRHLDRRFATWISHDMCHYTPYNLLRNPSKAHSRSLLKAIERSYKAIPAMTSGEAGQ